MNTQLVEHLLDHATGSLERIADALERSDPLRSVMLKALKLAEGALDDGTIALAEVRAAIAKAEGRSDE